MAESAAKARWKRGFAHAVSLVERRKQATAMARRNSHPAYRETSPVPVEVNHPPPSTPSPKGFGGAAPTNDFASRLERPEEEVKVPVNACMNA